MISSSLSPSLISLPSNSTELLLSSIIHRKHRLFIGTFYRPPSSNTAIASLSSVLSNLSSSILSNNLILVGDFNVNYTSSSTSPLFLELSLALNPILFLKSYLTQLTSLMPALPLSLILLLFPQLFILTILFFPLFLLLTIMQFFSQFLFLFLFLALTNPPTGASGSTTKLTNLINSLLPLSHGTLFYLLILTLLGSHSSLFFFK